MTTSPQKMPHSPTHWAAPWIFLAIDLVMVAIFAAVGRSSHGENLGGTLITAWPFLVGTLVTWVAGRLWRFPAMIWPSGILVWAGTYLIGMALRHATGQGTHWSFLIVAGVTIGVFLLVPRGIATLLSRRHRKPILPH